MDDFFVPPWFGAFFDPPDLVKFLRNCLSLPAHFQAYFSPNSYVLFSLTFCSTVLPLSSCGASLVSVHFGALPRTVTANFGGAAEMFFPDLRFFFFSFSIFFGLECNFFCRPLSYTPLVCTPLLGHPLGLSSTSREWCGTLASSILVETFSHFPSPFFTTPLPCI